VMMISIPKVVNGMEEIAVVMSTQTTALWVFSKIVSIVQWIFLKTLHTQRRSFLLLTEFVFFDQKSSLLWSKQWVWKIFLLMVGYQKKS
jgi:hypothetical protein